MSTIGRDTIGEIDAGLSARGIETLDAPVTGGPPVARAGRLAMLVAGRSAAVEPAKPLLALMGSHVFVLGDRPGMGQLMKVVNNIVMATNVVTACEGLAMGAKAGLDAGVMLEVLGAGSGQSFAACEIVKRGVAGSFDFGAALSILDKDMALGVREAHALGAVVPMIERASEQWHAAYEAGLGGLDFTAILQFVEQRSGTTVRAR
jgi:3-hydroxyisobutyrate dehydrogenase